jgi:hypothetical protein
LPLLTRTSRQLLAEIWSFSFDAEHKFVVHLDSCNVRPLLERQGVFRLLSDVCGIDKIKEEDTTVVVHGGMVGEGLKWWLKKHWYEGLPLFDTNPEAMWKSHPSSTGKKSTIYRMSRSSSIYQLRAEYQKKCLGIVRYMRLIHHKDKAIWATLALRTVTRLD